MKRPTDNSVLIVGPGAMGLFFAGHLCRAGVSVALLDHCPDRARLLHHIVLRETGHEQDMPVTCEANPQMVENYAHVLICVKAHSTRHVVEALYPYIAPDTYTLSLQNGLGNRELLATLPCRHNVRIGITSYGAYLVNSHTVQVAGNGSIQMQGTPTDPVSMQWRNLLEQAHLHTTLHENMDEILWTKLILNAAINPVTALYNIRNGELEPHPTAWQRASAILTESVAIANGLGIRIEAGILQHALSDICEKTRYNCSSMLMDVRAGRPTEVHAINGAIISAAQKVGLPAPANQKIVKEILSRDAMPT